MGAIDKENRADFPPQFRSAQSDRVISYREVLEQLATDELRAGRLNRRSHVRFVQMAKEYRFTETEAKDMIQAGIERLEREGLVMPDLANLESSSTDGRRRLVAVAIILLAIQTLWWMLS